MKLESTGYTAEEIKDMVNEYMIETYDRFDFVAERGEGMSTMKRACRTWISTPALR